MEKKGNITVTDGVSIRFREPTDLFFCDPCYVVGRSPEDNDWQDFCDLMFGNDRKYDREGMAYVITPNGGVQFLYSGTAYGDGCYRVNYSGSQVGHEAGVDAGMLAVFTLEDIYKLLPKISDEELQRTGVTLKEFVGRIDIDGEGNWEGSKGFSCNTAGDDEEYECDRCGCEVDEYETYCWSCEEHMEEEDDDLDW
jgi:hypothetical protein